ncbi:MAG: glucose-1-phosphate adenylyltransferase [Nitrospinae bacterium]|nr:glucose-1-phosphate adenylyltransferase [Nitrospinota bacterium]
MQRVLAMILAGGEGKRLYPLTKERAKPAVPFGGRYRIIDFVLSNFVNSGFYQIKVLTQFKSESLNRHLSLAWRLSPKLDQYIDPVPAQMRTGRDWYKGTADAIYQNLNLIKDVNPDYVCIFAGDHIYKMDIRQMLNFHMRNKAEFTLSAVPKPIKEASSYGVIEVDREWRIEGFEEKPKKPSHIPKNPEVALVSMGNYIFNTDTLIEAVTADAKNNDSSHDFGRDIIPSIKKKNRLFVYNFARNKIPGMTDAEKGYWMDVGSIDAYWQASMDLVAVSPIFNLYNEEWQIRTYYHPYPPAKFVFADKETDRVGISTDSMVSEGCIISGGQINRSILSPQVRINSYSYVTESILMEGVNVGRHTRIKRAIIDKFVNIPPETEIGYNIKEDKKRFYVTESGIVVVPKETILKRRR